MSLAVHRADDRFTTRTDGILSRHAFSFGAHYDATNTGFGRLVACNEEELAVGAGFPAHPHAGLDILTWVIEGALEHEDDTGASAVLRPGHVQRLRAGTGVRHAETNAHAGRTRFVQLWLRSEQPAAVPSYEQHDARPALAGGGVVPVLHADDDVDLHVGRLSPGTSSWLPEAHRVHVLVTRGAAVVGGAWVVTGDSVRITGAAAAVAVEVPAEVPAEVVVLTLPGE